jgi:lysyl-tRNA synthetase class 2
MFVTNLLLLEKKHHFFSVLSLSYQRLSEFSDSFFPQMKPETFGGPKGPELTENEQLVFDILSKEGSMDLNALKEQAGLSNKQWDKSMKGLSKHGLTKVTKTEDTLTVEVVG